MTRAGVALPDVLPTALDLLAGRPGAQMETVTEPGAHRIVVWLIDGLGHDQLVHALDWGLMPRLEGLLSSRQAVSRPIQSVFPSITPVALASLLTGTWPGEHSLIGRYIQEYPDAPRVDTLGRGTGTTPAPLLEKTVDRRAEELGMDYRSVIEDRLLNGTLTRLLHPLTDHIVSYVSPLAIRPRLLEALSRARPGLAYVYWPYLDSTNHLRGPYSRDWVEEMAELDRVLGAVVDDAPKGRPVWLWITADHGHQAVQEILPYGLLRGVVPSLPEWPLGCERVAGLRLTAEQADVVQRAADSLFPGKVLMRPIDDYVKSGDFGPRVRPGVPGRVGNWLLEAGDGCIWNWDERDRMAVSNHGGRSAVEMTIPLVEICLN